MIPWLHPSQYQRKGSLADQRFELYLLRLDWSSGWLLAPISQRRVFVVRQIDMILRRGR